MLLSYTLHYNFKYPITVYYPPVFAQHRHVREMHLILLNKARNVNNWWLPFADPIFYSDNTFKDLYCTIGALMNPPMSEDELTVMPSDVRHSFFIATEPVEHPGLKQMVPGLSILEQLMGFRYEKSTEKTWVTSGDSLIDLHADLLICFGADGTRHLTENYGVQYLWELVRQYSDRQRGEKAVEERRNNALTAQANEEFEENLDDYMGAVARAGVYVPQVFFSSEDKER